MKKYAFLSAAAAVFMFLHCSISLASTVPNDIVLMIDNSGSMKKGDPFFVTKDSLTQFVEKLPTGSGDTQVAVLIFDHRVNLAVPLTTLSQETKKEILSSLDDMDYRGKLTNIPAAMERAIYELKTQGQEDSQKSIIFITDGIVDTGDKLRDVDNAKWLREILSQDAARHGIKIFGIAFTDFADFELIQSLALKTNGLYFRAGIPEEIPGVFSQLHQRIIRMKPELVEQAKPHPPPPQPSTAPQEPPTAELEKSPIYVTEAPEPTPAPVKPKRLNLPIIVAICLAVFLISALIIRLRFRQKPGIASPVPEGPVGVTDEFLPEASLRDVSGVTTGQGIIKINKKVTKIGRISQINHITIDQNTISRQHAIIEYKDYSFWIQDQGSSNGTFLNGNKIVDQMKLNNGDTISFDIYEFEFVMPETQFDKTVVDQTVFRHAGGPEKG
jgi:uncharacterized protein YegL